VTPGALLAPLDAARSALLRPWAGGLRGLVRSRARRVAFGGALGVSLAFALALGAPLWTLALGPVLLGVPHVLADVRYLVVRPALHRRVPLLVLAGAPLLVAAIEPRVELGLFAAVGAVLAARASLTRKAVLLVVLAGLLVAAWNEGFYAQVALLHVHNAIALALWWGWRKRSASAFVVPLLAVAGAAAILTGAVEPLSWVGPVDPLLDVYAPDLAPVPAARLLLSFVFLQSVHYLVWLRLVPEDDRDRPAPRPFRASWEALRADFGAPALALVGAAALGIAAWGAFDLGGARDGYLRLAGFHGYLELAVLALWAAEGARWRQ
jgi:hypothetical protein